MLSDWVGERYLSGNAYWREGGPFRIGLPHQLLRAERSILSSIVFCEGDEQNRSSDKNGQQNSHSLCQQDGMTHNISALLLGITNLGVVSGLQHYSPHIVLTWKGQYQGRLGVLPSAGQQ